MRLIAIFALDLLCTFLFASRSGLPGGREVGYLDLTHIGPTHRVREPLTGSGGGIGVGGNGLNRSEPLTLTLLSVGYDANREHQIEFEVKLANTSTSVVSIPWDTSIADIEPSTPKQAYSYSSVCLSLWSPQMVRVSFLLCQPPWNR